MTVTWTIRLFAGLSDRFGAPEVILELPQEQLTVAGLKEALAAQYEAHAQLIAISFMARNQAYASDDEHIRAGDELALLPPVSGGEDSESNEESGKTPAPDKYRVTTDPLSVEAITAQVIVPNNGAALTFTGTTREWTQGQRTIRLEYEAYVPMAIKTLQQIGNEIAAQWPGTECAIWHRIGVVDVAEISVIIAVSSPHREACYDASRYAIERLKQIVPIWKREIWEDGSEWKGHQQGPWNPIATRG
ncbi:molybdopterin converting factor [Paenibacillus rhizovicinus]|uniref:Molybdopterin synthase catalytic subunit n=1 Tax=Paenibacillus rhizovicinus TaxID=2704463 RepID=A0A6C0NWT8_9BACL|nr:molybdenum cofactor biosynthesis protein MoaE [Paenibacillus rhizovicinus]QHW30659.1 molybdopterin converting factor [Paenibacillus rhizovicinus]